MRFEELRLRNFFSFGKKEQTIELANRGLVLIEGENRDDPTTTSNGAGKSALFEGILWALFGKTLRYGKHADKVLNRHTGRENCSVKLTFADDSGKSYRVERYRADEEFKNKLILVGPKGPFTFSDSSETQAKINSLIGMDFESFTNSVVFGQKMTKHFAAMTDLEQKAIMDRIIGVEAIAQAHKRAKDRAKDIETKRDNILARGAEEKVESLKEELEEAKAEEAGWQEKHDKKVKDKRAELRNSASDEDVKNAKRLMKEYEEALEQCKAGVKVAEKDLNEVESEWKALKQKKVASSEALELVNTEAGKCDHCGSDVTGDQLEQHRRVLERALEKAQEAADAAFKKVEEARDQKEYQEKVEEEAETALSKARKKLSGLEAQRAVSKRLEAELEELEEETNPHGGRVKKLKASLEEAEAKMAEDLRAYKELSNEMKYVTFAIGMFSDKGADGKPPLKGCLLDNVAPFLNEKAAYYSKYLTRGNIEISFQTQRELVSGEAKDEFRVVTNNVYGADDYDGSSGGEAQKIDVCVALSLQALGASRVRSSVNLGFWDEVFESLDDAAVDCVMELLSEEAKTKESVFVITHLAGLKSYFPSRIKLVKQDGITTLAR